MFWRLSSWIAILMLGFVGIFLNEEKNRFVFKFLLGLVFAVILNLSLKFIFNIPRYIGFGPAFPSFHAQMAFFIAVMASLEKPRLGWFLLPLAGLISFSRVALGFHLLGEVVAGAFLGTLVAYWFFKVKLSAVYRKELARQLVHLSGILLVPLAIILPEKIAGALCFLAALFIIFAPWTPVARIAKAFQRFRERGYRGAFYFFLASGFVLFVFPFEAAAAGIIALSVGDSIATIYGRHIGKIHLFKHKSLEGSLACFLFVYAAVVFILGRELALPIALTGTFVELFPWFDDNLLIPPGVALVTYLVRLI